MSSIATKLAAPNGLFSGVEGAAPDALLALIGLHAADPRRDKIDIGVGVYRDVRGQTPVFAAVKEAERRLLLEQASKSYLGAEGDTRFTALLAEVVFGADLAAAPGLVGLQTPGGTGALRLAAELLAGTPSAGQVWVGEPTWANHVPLLGAAGLKVGKHRFFDPAKGDLDFEGMTAALETAPAGDILLLHGCCHNPTGISFSVAQWDALAELCLDRGLFPFIDLAYQGLGDGLEDDVAGLRRFLARVPEALIAYSCDKNFGVYRERVGALWAWSPTRDTGKRLLSRLCSLARVNWSMPPDHGAASVAIILGDAALRSSWTEQLEVMRLRIAALRQQLAQGHPRLAPLGTQKGMFALLPLAPPMVTALREDHGIYMAPDGRINIAGLEEGSVGRFVAALAPYLDA